MSRLPNARHAIVPEAKVVGYLLSRTHAFGRTKAAFFESFGFTSTAWRALSQALLDHAEKGDIVKTEETPLGRNLLLKDRLAHQTVETQPSAPSGLSKLANHSRVS